MLYISTMEVNEEKFKERKLALKELIVYSEDFLGSHLARIQLATTMDQLNDVYSDFIKRNSKKTPRL